MKLLDKPSKIGKDAKIISTINANEWGIIKYPGEPPMPTVSVKEVKRLNVELIKRYVDILVASGKLKINEHERAIFEALSDHINDYYDKVVKDILEYDEQRK